MKPWHVVGGGASSGRLGIVIVIVAVARGWPGSTSTSIIEGPAPAKLQLFADKNTTSTSSDSGTAGDASSVSGTWNVGPASLADYRAQEVLLGQNARAVGRTKKIWGSPTLEGTTVTAGTFNVNMASVVSDQIQRNARFDGPIMDVSPFPTATLTLTAPIALGTVPSAGTTGAIRPRAHSPCTA